MKQAFSLLIKPSSADCNLRCTYCFYLKKSELYPESKIHRMSDEVLEKMISSYLSTDQPVYVFGWQGGEPTLMGLEFFEKVIALQQKYGKGKTVSNSLQTNGTLLDEPFAQFLARYNFLVGISLDGPPEVHNMYRTRVDGSHTHASVLQGIEHLEKNEVEFNVLTLVNQANVSKGREIYDYLCSQNINYQQYIPCVEFDQKGNLAPFAITGEQWGQFLCDVYDEWIKRDTNRVSIRTFDGIVNHMVNGSYAACHMAGNCCQYFVVEHNGDIYPCDFYVEEERRLGNLLQDSWADMQNADKYLEFGNRKAEWNQQCSQCEFLTYCAGDCPKHRSYNANEDSHLSWLCDGWKMFYQHSLPGFRKLAENYVRHNSVKSAPKLFVDRKFDRNGSCYCGSNKKYKKCHGAIG
ncbi:MAG TPA: anaerobic sulfatase maturase [Clostridiales bacterium]|nr:anaerobic sulfatase maturase [Clostridiales bacterium]